MVLSLSGKYLCVNDVWELAEGCHFDRDIDVVQVCLYTTYNSIVIHDFIHLHG